MMDHGRLGPPGLVGGGAGAVNEIELGRGNERLHPAHLSKGQGYELGPDDWVQIRTPGGGGYGPASQRDPELAERDRRRGYYPRREG